MRPLKRSTIPFASVRIGGAMLDPDIGAKVVEVMPACLRTLAQTKEQFSEGLSVVGRHAGPDH